MSPSKRRIEWTGERCVPWTDDLQVIYEHYQRYLFIAPLCKGKRVLDLACGEGYGSAILANVGDAVVGVDVDLDTVLHATESYSLPGLSFTRGDMLDLSDMDDHQFDVIVCFEAIEHVEDHQRLLANVKRLLATDGIIAVSTPDRLTYNEGQHLENPFHVHELSREEFESLLLEQFRNVALWGQNVSVGSLLTALGPTTGLGELVPIARVDDAWMRSDLPPPTYYVAVATDGLVPDLPRFSSLVDMDLELIQETRRLQDHQRQHSDAVIAGLTHIEVEDLAELQQAATEIHRLGLRTQSLRHSVSNARTYVGGLYSEIDRQARYIEEIEGHYARAIAQFDAIRTSREFRIGQYLYARAERVMPTGSAARRQLAMVRRKMRGLPTSLPPELPQLAMSTDSPTAAEAVEFGPLPAFPTDEYPRVSIVIPVHNEWQMTLRCLWSISVDIAAIPFEIIVVDDASSDPTPQLLEGIPGITVVRLDKNVGFLRAVNEGASRARGDYFILLNNDVEVAPGWLEALADEADRESDVGIVGARLVYPDGLLQEAGGVIFRDGSGWNYGRFNDPGHPSFNFPRDVDYCSGACLLVRRDLWLKVGGFDVTFAPAYYEEVDLAFSARKLGFRVRYQPLAVVVHHEGASYGTDESPRKTALMAANREKLVHKWADELQAHPVRDEKRVRAASWRRPAGHALVVDHQTPTFDQDAGSQRMFELLKMLNDLGYAVTFVPFNGNDEPRYTKALVDLGIEVFHGPIDIADLIDQLAPDLRLVLLSRPKVAWGIVPLVRELAPDATVIYDTVDLHYLRERRRSEIESGSDAQRMSEHYEALELWLARECDATFAVSRDEEAVLRREAPSKPVYVIPTVHRSQHPGGGFNSREGLLFVGGFNHPPNRDAVEWFVNEILPHIRRDLPDVPVSIVGSNPTEEVLQLAGDGVDVLGWVEDLRPLYWRSRLFVAPLRYGAGIRGKIGESASFGLPVVTTTVGAEGFDLVDNESIRIADDPVAFAAAVVETYSDPVTWSRIGAMSRQAVALQCSPPSVRNTLAAALSQVLRTKAQHGD